LGEEAVRVLLTGGAGDLGTVLTSVLERQGATAVRLDIVPPADHRGLYVAGSVLDRLCLDTALSGGRYMHIAAWHGIHETSGRKAAYDFWDLNVTGERLRSGGAGGVKQVVFISSTSIRNRYSLYGHTKVLGNRPHRAMRHAMQVVTLRPRGFIPHWNRATYASFIEWAQWFWRGAVHIDDVAQAVLKSLNLLATSALERELNLVVDGAYDYTDEDLQQWDRHGPGTTFRTYYPQYYDLAVRYGLDPAAKPHKLDSTATQRWFGVCRHSLRHLLRN
jgi:nucleoside-diphosphate-sugar epimerase